MNFTCPHQPGNLNLSEEACIANQRRARTCAQAKLDRSFWLAWEPCLNCNLGKSIAKKHGVNLKSIKRRSGRCKVPGCRHEAAIRGLCRVHYAAWYYGRDEMVDLVGPFCASEEWRGREQRELMGVYA